MRGSPTTCRSSAQAGYATCVCDNMAFAGALIALRRKHTGNLDIHTELAEAMTRYVRDARRLQEDISIQKLRPAPACSATVQLGRFFKRAGSVKRFSLAKIATIRASSLYDDSNKEEGGINRVFTLFTPRQVRGLLSWRTYGFPHV